MGRIARTRRARFDAYQILLDEAIKSDAAEERLRQRLAEALQKLAENPWMGGNVELGKLPIRHFPVGTLVIYYTIMPDGILVNRILRGSRQVSSGMFGDTMPEPEGEV